jgi:hypothetical protein
MIRRWETLLQEGQTLGFTRFIEPVQDLTQLMVRKRHVLAWDWQQTARAAFNLALVVRFAQEKIAF